MLTLGVGRSLAGAFETWFLAFLNTGIASQQTLGAQSCAHGFIFRNKGACQTEFDSIALTAHAAALYFDCNIKG